MLRTGSDLVPGDSERGDAVQRVVRAEVTATGKHVLCSPLHTQCHKRVCLRWREGLAFAIAQSFDNDLIPRAVIEDVFVAWCIHHSGPRALHLLDFNPEVAKVTTHHSPRVDDRYRRFGGGLWYGLVEKCTTAVTALALGAGLVARRSQSA